MVNYFVLERFYVKRKLSCRHRDVSKSMEKVKVLSRLAGGYPHGCNVGINKVKSRGGSCGFLGI